MAAHDDVVKDIKGSIDKTPDNLKRKRGKMRTGRASRSEGGGGRAGPDGGHGGGQGGEGRRSEGPRRPGAAGQVQLGPAPSVGLDHGRQD